MEGQSGSVWFVLREVPRRTHMRSHPRLLTAAAVAFILYWILSGWTGTATGFLVTFDSGALVFLAAVWIMMAQATPDGMRSEIEDEGRYSVLGFSAAAATAILFAIVFELHGIKDRPSDVAGFQVALAVATILLSWLFMNTMFALHYAHGYYGDADPPANTRR